MLQITGYHTLEDRGNPEEVESNGPFICRRSNAWLGNGYYFWDTKIEWAHKWGETYREGYIICEAKIIQDDRLFDLYGRISHQEEFIDICEELRQSPFFRGKVLRVAEILEWMKKQGILDYDAIRAGDLPNQNVIKINFTNPVQGKSKPASLNLFVNPRVQICLITKKNLVSHTFCIVFPETYTNHK